jgi:glucose/arabinose dehydrogenase
MTGLTYHRRLAARDLPRSEPRLPQHHHDAYRGGAFVGEHGSWNRQRLNGYTVVFVPFDGGRPSGMAKDVVTGFLDGDNRARGRPVGVAIDKSSALLIADDVGNSVWRFTSAGP